MTKPKNKLFQVYRYFDAGGDLLYVGSSVSAVARAIQHRSDSSWYPEAARIDIATVGSREEMLEVEKQAIIEEAPKHNVTYHPERFQRFLTSERAREMSERKRVTHPGAARRWALLRGTKGYREVEAHWKDRRILSAEEAIATAPEAADEIRMASVSTWTRIFGGRKSDLKPAVAVTKEVARQMYDLFWAARWSHADIAAEYEVPERVVGGHIRRLQGGPKLTRDELLDIQRMMVSDGVSLEDVSAWYGLSTESIRSRLKSLTQISDAQIAKAWKRVHEGKVVRGRFVKETRVAVAAELGITTHQLARRFKEHEADVAEAVKPVRKKPAAKRRSTKR